MGGQLIKGHSIQGDALCTTGIVDSWKLFKAQNSSSHTAASIFLIEKKQLRKQDKEAILRMSKKEACSLVRVRHPGVLAVIEPLTEDENVLAFVSERVEGNLLLFLKQNRLQQFISSELELKLFLYPLLETVEFIHSSLKQAHLAVSLESIYLTGEGKWKVGGFGINQVVTSEEPVQGAELLANLACTAPETVNQGSFSKKSDIFSLGVVILRLVEYIHKAYKPGQPVRNQQEYERQLRDVREVASHPVVSKSVQPAQLSSLLRGMLGVSASQRPSITEVLSSEWMNDSTLMTVKHLDKISNYEGKQQLEFLKGVAGVLDDFPERVLLRIIVPKLLDLLKYNSLIASIVYIVVDLLRKDKLKTDTFRKEVWPTLRTITTAKQITAQAIYLIVVHFQLFEKHVGEADMATYIMPLYLKCYDCPAKLKQLALSMVARVSKKVDYQYLKTRLLPKLLGLLKDQSIQIRKDTLRALLPILTIIDTQTVSLTILPGLQTARRAGTDPFVNAIVAHIYKTLGQSLPLDVVSGKILPTLIPYLTDPSITRTEFSSWKGIIYGMVDRIEVEAVKTLEVSVISTFSEDDFKFKEVGLKPTVSEQKGDYKFLSMYSDKKEEAPQPSNPASILSSVPASPMPDSPLVTHPEASIPSMFTQAQQQFSAPVSLKPLSIPDNFFSFPCHVSSEATEQHTMNLQPSFQIKQSGSHESYLPAFKFQSKPTKIPNHKEEAPFILGTYPSLPTANVLPPTKVQSPKKKQAAFVGGASGPMEIKRLVGPPKSEAPKLNKVSLNQPLATTNERSWGLEPTKEISINFDSLNTFGSMSSSVPGGVLSGKLNSGPPSSQSNPFEDIEDRKPEVNGTSQNSDIYSYFETETLPVSGLVASKKSNFDDLI